MHAEIYLALKLNVKLNSMTCKLLLVAVTDSTSTCTINGLPTVPLISAIKSSTETLSTSVTVYEVSTKPTVITAGKKK